MKKIKHQERIARKDRRRDKEASWQKIRKGSLSQNNKKNSKRSKKQKNLASNIKRANKRKDIEPTWMFVSIAQKHL